MIEDDALVDLAQCCARACLVSRNVTKGRGAGGLSEPAQKAIESLKKYADSAQLLLSNLKNTTRIVLNIESEVAEHAPSAKFLPGYFPGFTEVFPTLWKVDLQKAPEDIDVCGNYFGLLRFLNYFSDVWRQRLPPCPEKASA
jgi:hypothetical protein